MANDTNKIKLLVLWDILCKNTDENHAMNSDEIREELAKRGISVMRKVVATDIAALPSAFPVRRKRQQSHFRAGNGNG